MGLFSKKRMRNLKILSKYSVLRMKKKLRPVCPDSTFGNLLRHQA